MLLDTTVLTMFISDMFIFLFLTMCSFAAIPHPEPILRREG